MSKIHSEEVEIFGTLYTEFGTFSLLNMEPRRYVPSVILQQLGFISFYVVDVDGFAKYVTVNSHNVMIKPVSEVSKKVVNFLLADEPQEI